ncbi:unnamed protein product, partial [Ixodes hexagonus]
FYRPYQTRNEKDGDDDIDDVQQLLEKECQDTLLFCYQSKFMRDIMAKYGGYVACMDATNKTTDYALLLSLVVVKTPCGYVTVGVFIVQFETQTCISEALSVLRKWCPNFQPQYWMADYCHAEINALHETFPESKVVLCDFHREQAWDRWMRKEENCVQAKEVLLHLLRKIANSTSEEELQQSNEDLQSSAVWLQNVRLQHYITTQWLAVKEMWARSHRLEHDILLTVEAQNKVVKEFYLKSSHGRKSLTGLISVLVQKFLPERKNNYQKEDMRLSSSYRKYSSEVPEYLHNRPPTFIKHVMTRMCATADLTLHDIKALPSPGTFSVRSQGKEGDYHVDYGAPSCTCADFVRVKCPCKHFCAIFQLVDGLMA